MPATPAAAAPAAASAVATSWLRRTPPAAPRAPPRRACGSATHAAEAGAPTSQACLLVAALAPRFCISVDSRVPFCRRLPRSHQTNPNRPARHSCKRCARGPAQPSAFDPPLGSPSDDAIPTRPRSPPLLPLLVLPDCLRPACPELRPRERFTHPAPTHATLSECIPHGRSLRAPPLIPCTPAAPGLPIYRHQHLNPLPSASASRMHIACPPVCLSTRLPGPLGPSCKQHFAHSHGAAGAGRAVQSSRGSPLPACQVARASFTRSWRCGGAPGQPRPAALQPASVKLHAARARRQAERAKVPRVVPAMRAWGAQAGSASGSGSAHSRWDDRRRIPLALCFQAFLCSHDEPLVGSSQGLGARQRPAARGHALPAVLRVARAECALRAAAPLASVVQHVSQPWSSPAGERPRPADQLGPLELPHGRLHGGTGPSEALRAAEAGRPSRPFGGGGPPPAVQRRRRPAAAARDTCFQLCTSRPSGPSPRPPLRLLASPAAPAPCAPAAAARRPARPARLQPRRWWAASSRLGPAARAARALPLPRLARSSPSTTWPTIPPTWRAPGRSPTRSAACESRPVGRGRSGTEVPCWARGWEVRADARQLPCRALHRWPSLPPLPRARTQVGQPADRHAVGALQAQRGAGALRRHRHPPSPVRRRAHRRRDRGRRRGPRPRRECGGGAWGVGMHGRVGRLLAARGQRWPQRASQPASRPAARLAACSGLRMRGCTLCHQPSGRQPCALWRFSHASPRAAPLTPARPCCLPCQPSLDDRRWRVARAARLR